MSMEYYIVYILNRKTACKNNCKPRVTNRYNESSSMSNSASPAEHILSLPSTSQTTLSVGAVKSTLGNLDNQRRIREGERFKVGGVL
jgi:hypothetical protein